MHDFVELILNLLQKAGILAVIAAGLCVIGILAAYVILRCVTKGKKKFPWLKCSIHIVRRTDDENKLEGHTHIP